MKEKVTPQALTMSGSPPRTYEALIIHRTALLYRLKKIQSLIHINPDGPWQRLYLTLSLWILEKENKICNHVLRLLRFPVGGIYPMTR